MRLQTRRPVIIGVVILVITGTLTATGAGTMAQQSVPAPSTSSETSPQPASEVGSNATDSGHDDDGNFSVPSRDHGVNATVFPRLWSGDVDEAGATGDGTVSGVVLSATDYAFSRPPDVVETWNAGDHQEFPRTDANASVYPPHADLTDERWIEDAYIEVFAIQPSTVAHISPDDRRHYIRPSGQVLGTTDYRIGLPPDEHRDYDPPTPEPGETVLEAESVTWRLLEHEMSNVTLLADGEPVATTDPTHRSRLAFDAIPNSTDRLTLEVTISATVEKTTRKTYRTATEDCDTQPTEANTDTQVETDCDVSYDTHQTSDVEVLSHEVTVRDTVDVDVYALSPTATRTTFTDGSSALAVNKSDGDPWAMYQLQNGDTVHNLWHFYSARNRHWHTLIQGTETGTTRRQSDAIPLQVHAFPSDGGAYTRAGFRALEVTQVWGPERRPPALHDSITIPVVDGSYSSGSVVVVRSDGVVELDGRVTVHGLVRGTQTQTAIRTTQDQQATALEVELLGVNRSEGTATVRLSLRETATDQPIDLRSRPGVVVVNGEVVEPNASGTAVVTVPLAGQFVAAEYEPGSWWATDPVYDSARASVAPPTEWPDPQGLLTAAFLVVLWLSPLLFGIYLIDRLLGKGRLWPPWRGVE